jgi:hypothetical protein
MSFEPPAGILDIGNATLRVGKLEVAETAGLNQGLQNIVKNDLLITEKETYLANKTWGIKLPTAWVGEFDLKTHDNKYVEFNFYNEGSTSNAHGYTLNFKDTTLTLKYDNGNTLASETIPDVSTSTYKKVNVFFERGVIAVFIDGARVLYFKESDTYNSVHGHPGMASRVASTTGGSFVNIFIEADGSDSAVKDLRIVNGRFISDKTSNVSFIGSLGVGVNSPQESLDIRGNMHFNRVSNVSQIKVDSNVVAEYTGPHDRPLREYPEINMTAATTGGYTASASIENNTTTHAAFNAFTSEGFNRWQNGGTRYDTNSPFLHTAGESTTDTDGTSHLGDWIQLQLPNKINLSRIRFSQHSSAPAYQPKSYVVLGSNDDTSWKLIHTQTNLPEASANTNYKAEDNFMTVGYYKYLRLVVKSLQTSVNQIIILRLQYYGHEEGSGSLDTTLKSVYNVPATTGTQLEVYYDGQDYSEVTSTVNDKVGTATNATIANTDSAITFDSTYKAWTFGGTDTRTSNFQSSALPSNFSGDQVHSVALWFKCDIVSGDTLFSITQPSDPWEDPKKVISVRFSDESGGLRYLFWSNDIQYDGTEAKITKDIWYHLCVTYSGGGGTTENKKLYLNGNELHHTSTSGDYPGADLELPSGSVIRLGSRVQETTRFFGSIANFRLYSKALNADQVKELYDYQKDYFLGSKSQVTLYKGHLGVGVTEPSGQLELAGDERIQEYPPRAMTHSDGTALAAQTVGKSKNITYIEGHGEFKASASKWSVGTTGYDGQQPYNAFDKSTVRGWLSYENVGYNNTTGAYEDNEYILSASSGTPYGHWLKLEMPYTINIKSYFLDGSGRNYSPHDWQIWASNDDNNWTHIHSYSGETYDASNGRYYTVSHTGHYKMFAIIVTSIHAGATELGSPTDRIWIKEMKYFGTPGPTTLDKGSLSLTRSLDVPRVSRYDVDTETPRPEKLLVDFDTTVNSSPTDISGQGNHGTMVGATYSAADKAFVFDGTDDYIDIPSVSGVGTGAWVHSKSFWFKLHSSTDAGVLFLLGRNGSTKQIAVQSNGSGQFQYYIYGCNSRVQVNGSDWFPDVNRWYHCVTIFKNNETTATGGVITGREMYIDGVKQTLVALSTQVSLDLDSSEVRFGNQFNSIYLDYELSNPKLYNVALEPSEVKKLYNLGRTGRSMVISDTAVGIGKVPEAQLDVRGNLAVRGDVEAYGKNFNMSPAGNLSILGNIYGASVIGGFVRSSYNTYGFDGAWRGLISTVAYDCGLGFLVHHTGSQHAMFRFAHTGDGTKSVGWIYNSGYTNIAYSGSTIKVQGPGNITRGYILYLNNS